MKTDRIIDIMDDDRPDDRPVETPVFAIETTGGNPSGDHPILPPTTHRRRGRGWILAVTLLSIALLICVGWILYATYSTPYGIKSMMSDSDNIKVLQSSGNPTASGTILTTDSILGVALDMYSLSGLKASLETQLPDTADSSLVLFMRSADYHSDRSVIGTTVVDGEAIACNANKERAAYMAISQDGTPAIGISSSDKVADYVQKNGGSFFRQFPLLGNGELPTEFHLHGKVARAAIARMPDGEMHYVVTPHPETMYAFADALREYGFADAIYITGGKNYRYYRTADGTAYINHESLSKLEKYSGSTPSAPFLVFRRK